MTSSVGIDADADDAGRRASRHDGGTAKARRATHRSASPSPSDSQNRCSRPDGATVVDGPERRGDRAAEAVILKAIFAP